MRYIINFQVKILNPQNNTDVVRSSYTVLEKESEKNNLSNFTKVEGWFNELFNKEPLDYFINTSKLNNNKNYEMKIGRITDSISGKYKTF